ncbi:MAG: hypothetical protein Q9M97_06595 [Candidatus Gracilibacteria bacterium]|nr:hypothetical protein [Candidatus Gracilibacteria bacterium]
MEKLLEYPKMRSSIYSLMPKNEEEEKNMMKEINKKEDKAVLEEMQRIIGEYYLKYDEHMKIYNNFIIQNKGEDHNSKNEQEKRNYQIETNKKIENNFNLKGLNSIQKSLSIVLLKQTNYELLYGKRGLKYKNELFKN